MGMTENDQHRNKKVKVSDEVEEGEEDEFELEQENNEHVESLYLETIQRKNLDFDFEKLCSVSLSNSNVYACLTCGKYFQGRGKSSHAYLHSVDIDHHVYINLQTLRIYVLPEGYEVKSASLDDIKYVVDPKYTKDQILSLDSSPKESYDLLRKPYWPGYIGINNIKENDYSNIIVQILAHVTPLRDFLLIGNIKKYPESINRLSLLVRKIWNPRAFKAHVSPHELLQHIAVVSQKRFTPIVQQDPFNFLNWFLNYLHLELGGLRTKSKSSLIQQVFQGKLQVESQRITSSAVPGDRLTFEADTKVEKLIIPFMFLSLDLPPTPLFQDAVNGSAIPQVLLSSLLAKYDGTTTQELVGHRKRYKIIELPQYLIFRVQDSTKTAW